LNSGEGKRKGPGTCYSAAFCLHEYTRDQQRFTILEVMAGD